LAEHVDMRDEIERRVREAVGLTSASQTQDQTIEVPDLVDGEAEDGAFEASVPSKKGKRD
jgi:hypothetical protein